MAVTGPSRVHACGVVVLQLCVAPQNPPESVKGAGGRRPLIGLSWPHIPYRYMTQWPVETRLECKEDKPVLPKQAASIYGAFVRAAEGLGPSQSVPSFFFRHYLSYL